MFFEVLIKSLIIGALGGAAVSAGAARMFHAPEVQAMGAFRTLGELNACKGDPIAHFSFGLGFFFNAAGSVIESENLEYDHDTVTVTIPIYKTRTLDLQVEFVNVPRGFPIEQLGYTLSRDTILVASPSETIDNIDAITVGPIDFRDIDIGTEITLDITLNAGLKNVENVDSVTVTFPSYGLTSRTMDVSKDNFVIENLPSGYTVEVLTEQLEDIRIVGDTSIVNDLTAEDLVGTIDLSQYSISRGRYTVSVKIYVQGRVLAWAVGEYSVEIEATPPETAESASTSG